MSIVEQIGAGIMSWSLAASGAALAVVVGVFWLAGRWGRR